MKTIKDYYFKDILGQILTGQQPDLLGLIDIYMEAAEEERYFEDLTIKEAIEFLKENWDEHFNDLLK